MRNPDSVASESPQLVVGLIGAGGISRMHAPAWKELGAHVLVHSADGAQALAEEFDLEAVLSLAEVLERAAIIDIVTPTSTHAAIALEAIAAGKDIVCEKPLTLTAQSSRTVLDAAQAAGVQMFPAHVVRYTAPYVAAHRAVEEGRIGRVAVARFHREGSSPAIGTWFQDVTLSGGVIMDLMLHDLDQARWTCGEVVSVYAVQNPPTVDGLIPPFVSAHVTLTHVGGAISHIRATWGATGTKFKTGFNIAGEKGVLKYSSVQNTGLTLELQGADDASLTIPEAPVRESPYLDEIREFAEAFHGGPAPRVSAEDGAFAVYLAEAAQHSLDTGRVVIMSEFRAGSEPGATQEEAA